VSRGAAPWLGFAVGAIAGYAVHRLVSKLLGEPDPRTVIAAEHVGFYWRAATATWWGLLLSAAAWRFPGAEAPLRRAFWPVLVGAVVLVAICR